MVRFAFGKVISPDAAERNWKKGQMGGRKMYLDPSQTANQNVLDMSTHDGWNGF